MTTAEPGRLLALFGQWGKNARVRNFPGLKFMAEMTHVAADRQVVDLTSAFPFARLFAAPEDGQTDETSADGAGA